MVRRKGRKFQLGRKQSAPALLEKKRKYTGRQENEERTKVSPVVDLSSPLGQEKRKQGQPVDNKGPDNRDG